MPYKIEKQKDQWCVMNTDTGENKGCSSSEDMAKQHMQAMYAAEKKALDEKAKNPDDYAYVPDEKSPSTWKLDISDPEHIAGAITALQPGGFRGQKVEIPAGDKGKVISRIRAAINKQVSDKDKKQALLDRLDKVKSVEKAFQGLLDQSEVNYVPLSATRGKACASCRWYMAMMDCCHLVEAMPEPILATGYCDRWEATPVPVEPDTPEPIPAYLVEPPMQEDDSQQMMSLIHAERDTTVELSRSVWKKLADWFPVIKSMLQPLPEADDAFSVFKAQDGKHYWLARHTGKWVDRESEIITDKAHEDYVNRVQKGLVPMPELWVWHKKGTRHGQADFVWKSGGFVLALGHFDDTPEGQKAIAYYQKQRGKIKLSHMFQYPKRAKNGRVFHAYNTVEITTLPDGAEAFPYTAFDEVKTMPFTKEQEDMIRAVGGDDLLKRAQSADGKAQADTKTLDSQGVESKGLDNFEGSDIPADKEIESLKAQTEALATRLKTVENVPDLLAAQQAAMKSQNDLIGQLQKTLSDNLAKTNTLEKQLLEYQAVAPPASKSNDTLLNQREKSLLEQMMVQAKSENSPSLIDSLVGGQPTVATGDVR